MAEITVGVSSFIEVIETIADNKYVLGDHLVDIGLGGPDLEATLSAIAMAQGELGHARLLYNWAFDLQGAKKQEIQSQTGKAFQGVVAVNDWISLIAALYAVNTAFELVLKAGLDGNHPDVAGRLSKLLKEQKEHILYSRGWVQQLLSDQGAVPRKMNESLDNVIPEVRAWLKKTEGSAALIQEGYLKAGTDLVNQFEQKIAQVQPPKVQSNAG